MSTRRYGDEEVREILSLASTDVPREAALAPDSGGLTLEELQRIGHEVGIEAAQIAQAARMLDARGTVTPVRRSFGMPVGLSRVVDLPRAPTDREWELLVAEFRSTFGAKGRTTTTGSIRDWSNGNLHIAVEPTEHGQRLRLTTLKDDGIALNMFGLATGAMSILSTAVIANSGNTQKAVAVLGMFGGMSLVSFATNVVRLPRWARERKRQMEAIGQRAVKLLSDT